MDPHVIHKHIVLFRYRAKFFFCMCQVLQRLNTLQKTQQDFCPACTALEVTSHNGLDYVIFYKQRSLPIRDLIGFIKKVKAKITEPES